MHAHIIDFKQAKEVLADKVAFKDVRQTILVQAAVWAKHGRFIDLEVLNKLLDNFAVNYSKDYDTLIQDVRRTIDNERGKFV